MNYLIPKLRGELLMLVFPLLVSSLVVSSDVVLRCSLQHFRNINRYANERQVVVSTPDKAETLFWDC